MRIKLKIRELSDVSRYNFMYRKVYCFYLSLEDPIIYTFDKVTSRFYFFVRQVKVILLKYLTICSIYHSILKETDPRGSMAQIFS